MAKTASELPNSLVSFLRTEFAALADPNKAVEMAAYMKTEMPFYGVQKPERSPIYKKFRKQFAPSDRSEYEACVSALWKERERESKYAALEYACMFDDFIVGDSLALYERLVIDGAWWDFVDVIAQHLVGRVLLKERPATKKLMYKWIDSPDLWIRRTALLSQNRHKQQTDEAQLFTHCLKRAQETEFFIRKAIGWALREYSYVAPDAVRDFLETNRSEFSNLSYREGLKALNRNAE